MTRCSIPAPPTKALPCGTAPVSYTHLLGVFAKNEVLEKLRTVVQEALVKGQYGRKNLESLLKLIIENIETQEFWDVFQNNFDLIHEKFFRNLRERYPLSLIHI